jgi:hypothetical protein
VLLQCLREGGLFADVRRVVRPATYETHLPRSYETDKDEDDLRHGCNIGSTISDNEGRGSFCRHPRDCCGPYPSLVSVPHKPSLLRLRRPCLTRTTTEEVSLPILKAKDSITLLRVSLALFPTFIMSSDGIGAPGPPPGQGGYYPQQPQQSYQGGPGYQGQPGPQPYPGYTPRNPNLRLSMCLYSPSARSTAFLRSSQSTGEGFRWRWRCLHRLFGRPSLLLLRRR